MFLDIDELSPLHEAYACALGRALAVCQDIEDCAHHVMLTWAVTDAMTQGTENRDELRELALRLKDVTLGGSIRRLSAATDFSSVHVEVIDAGREARN